MNRKYAIVAVLGTLVLSIPFVIMNMPEPESTKKIKWYFVPVECFEIELVKYSDKSRGIHEPCGCGVYSTTTDANRAILREEALKINQDLIEIDWSLCVEPGPGYGLND